jgi:hypothetical protein
VLSVHIIKFSDNKRILSQVFDRHFDPNLEKSNAHKLRVVKLGTLYQFLLLENITVPQKPTNNDKKNCK